MTILIKLERLSHKYPCCDPVHKHSTIPVTTTRNIPWVEFVFPTWDLAGYSKFGAQLWGTISSKIQNYRNVEGETDFKSRMQTGTLTNRTFFRRGATNSRCRQYHIRTEGASRRRGHLSLLNRPHPQYGRRLLQEKIRLQRPQLPPLILTAVHPK